MPKQISKTIPLSVEDRLAAERACRCIREAVTIGAPDVALAFADVLKELLARSASKPGERLKYIESARAIVERGTV